MRITSRYVLREHLGPLSFALAALTSLLLLNYIARRFADLVGKGLPWQAIAEFFLLSLPFTIAMTLPMAVLVSTLYAFSRLASENEITAFKASGVAMSRLLRPVLLGAAGLAVLMVFFNDQVLPRANHRLSILQADIARTRPTFAVREQVLNDFGDNFVLRAGHVDQQRNTMREVTVFDMSQPTPRTIIADSGVLALAPNGRDLLITFHDGVIEQVGQGKTEQLQRIFFRTQLVRRRDVTKSFEGSNPGEQTYKSDREMSICELQAAFERSRTEYLDARWEYRLARADSLKQPTPTRGSERGFLGIGRLYCDALAAGRVRTAGAQPPAAGGDSQPPAAAPVPPPPTPVYDSLARAMRAGPVVPLSVARLRYEDTMAAMNGYDVEIHKKFALAVACVVFVLLGAPIALRFPRGGVGLVIGVSLGVFALYYSFLIAGEELATRGILPPALAMWAANLVFSAVGLFLAARMGRESGSARGGGLGELVEQLRWRWRQRRAAAPGRAGDAAAATPLVGGRR